MGFEIALPGFTVDAALEREQALLRRVAAYACFVLAAWIVEGVACFLFAGPRMITDTLSQPHSDLFWMLVLPGPAAALGAAAVHIPFMRAVKVNRTRAAHGWAAAGVLAAHAAYGLLVFVFMLVLTRYLGIYEPFLLDPQPDFYSAAEQAMQAGFSVGAISLVLGFLPNLLLAELFAGFMVRLHREKQAIQPASAIQSILEVTRREFASSAK